MPKYAVDKSTKQLQKQIYQRKTKKNLRFNRDKVFFAIFKRE